VLVSGNIHPASAYLQNALLAALLIILLRRSPSLFRAQDRLLAAGLVLYFGASFISIPFSIMAWSSLRWFLFHLGDLFIFLAVMAAGKKRAFMIARAMLAAGAVSAAFALRQRLGGFAATLDSGLASDYARRTLLEGRVFGLTFSPDMLAGLLAGLIPLGLSMIAAGVFGKNRVERTRPAETAVAVIVLALLIAAFSLTRSVGGFLAAGAGVVVWLILHIDPVQSKKRLAALIVILSLAVLAGAAAVVLQRGGAWLDLTAAHNPVFRRLDNWATAGKVWQEFPLTGCGGGEAGLAMLKHRSLAGNEAKHAHDTFLEVLAETGPLGLLGVILLVIALVKNALGKWLRAGPSAGPAFAARGWLRFANDADDEIVYGLLAGAGAVFLHSLIDFDWTVTEVAAVFWTGLAASAWPTGRPQGPAAPGGRSRIMKAVIAGALVFTALAELYQARGAELRERAVAAARDQNWKRAQALAEKALAFDKTTDEMYELYARAVEMNGGDKARAVSALQKAIALNPRYPYYYRDLGLLSLTGAGADAGAMFRKAVSLYPNSKELNMVLGQWLNRTGRSHEAEKALLHAAQCEEDNGDALFMLGIVYEGQGKEGEAEKYLERSAWQKPAPNGSRAVYFAGFLVKRGRKNEAQEFLAKWNSRFPGDRAAAEKLRELRRQPGPGAGDNAGN
jgi:O-antigen ligase